MSWLDDIGLMMNGVDPTVIEEAKKQKKEQEKSDKLFLDKATQKGIKICAMICIIVFAFLTCVDFKQENYGLMVKNIVICVLAVGVFICNCLKKKLAEIVSLILVLIVFVMVFLL